MFQWWQNFESVAVFNSWIQAIALIFAAFTVVGVYLLWMSGNKMIRVLFDREQHANQRIKAIEKAAETIRKELLETQQSQDIADQKRRLAEMDADALRREMEKIRKRYHDAEGVLKDRIDDLKGLNITRGRDAGTATDEKKPGLDKQRQAVLGKLLSAGPKGELDMVAVLGNAASNQLAKDLMAVFNNSGWTAQGIVQSAFSNPPDGLILVIHSKQTAPSYAKFLQKTMTSAGFPVYAQINSKYREWSISMIVGQLE